ncbi:hypothetical protein AK812_SmicGene49145 [Symbiodinium microadriaticum]|uniref:Uncharacterized protein n=1 Tax=Symbiodinium microadriaticum TaxID=2951 RepID=A0A1Q9EDH4_SYMMI|nr:hypothetical protein AK812_SmicGene49145 [Symbiodinium microadriaticum]
MHKFPPAILIQCSFEVMGTWLLAEAILTGNAKLLRWMLVCCTRRFLPVQTMWFCCEVMDMLLLAGAMIKDNVIFPNSRQVCRTHRFLQVVLIQSFSEVMDVLLHVAAILRGNAQCQLWSRASHTPRFPQVLLRSDGRVAAFGQSKYGQCSVPSLKSWSDLFSCRSRRVDYISELRRNTLPKSS